MRDFDWHSYEQSSVKIALDSNAPGGTHGLLLSFLGPGFGETGLFPRFRCSRIPYQFSRTLRPITGVAWGSGTFWCGMKWTGCVSATRNFEESGERREVAGILKRVPEARESIQRADGSVPAGMPCGGIFDWISQLTRLEL